MTILLAYRCASAMTLLRFRLLAPCKASAWQLTDLRPLFQSGNPQRQHQQRHTTCSNNGTTSPRAAAIEEAASASTTIRCMIWDVPGVQADALADSLLDFGAHSASVTEHRPYDAEEQEIFDLQQGTREIWDRCTVTAHFPLGHNVGATLAISESLLGGSRLCWDVSEVADSEWVEGICASYQPTCIEGNLWIIPSWSEPVEQDAINIILEPGLAFGTGEHPTTRLCLKVLRTLPLEGQAVMDFGTGSGVLAILALKLGASLAVGTDTDPVAVRAALQNGRLNSFQGRLVALRCAATAAEEDPLDACPEAAGLPKTYDVCVANILQGPLLDLRPRLSAYVKPGGLLVLSGILSTQIPAIQAAYADHIGQFEALSEGPWAVITARKLR